MAWKPSLKRGVDLVELPLTPEEAFVALRLNGNTDTHTLAQVTGVSEEKVKAALVKLNSLGALSAYQSAPAPPRDEPDQAPKHKQSAAPRLNRSTPDPDEPAPELESEEEAAARAVANFEGDEGGGGSEPAEVTERTDLGERGEPREAAEGGPPPEEGGEGAEGGEAGEDNKATISDKDWAALQDHHGQHRQFFENNLKNLTIDARCAMAGGCREPELSALCFDGVSDVIKALVENSSFGPLQARLVCSNHKNSAGLDAVVARPQLAADGGVRRALLRNSQITINIMRKLWGNRRLIEMYMLTNSRDLPEGTRRLARELMRSKWATAEADDRYEVIVKSEARCLAQLVGLTIDGKTTSRLCTRTYSSVTFVQNLGRFAATPPPVLAHLMKQDIVKRNPQLRALLRRHPNAPSGIKNE